jgi:hypothetical protein
VLEIHVKHVFGAEPFVPEREQSFNVSAVFVAATSSTSSKISQNARNPVFRNNMGLMLRGITGRFPKG